MIKEAVERQGVPKRDWEARMVPIRYVGHHHKTASVMGLTPEGLKLGSGLSRLPEEQRWTLEGWSDLQGLPWDLKPGERDAPMAVQGAGESIPVMVTGPGQQEEEKVTRNFHVRRKHLEEFGFTPGCPGCNNLRQGGKGNVGYSVTHTPTCRERFFGKL